MTVKPFQFAKPGEDKPEGKADDKPADDPKPEEAATPAATEKPAEVDEVAALKAKLAAAEAAAAPAAEPAKTESTEVAATGGGAMSATGLDAWVTEGTPTEAPPAQKWPAYGFFDYPKNPKHDECVENIEGLKEGDFVIYGDGIPRRPADDFRFVCLRSYRYWGEFDGQGKLIGVSETQRAHPFRECVETQLLVIEGSKVTPVQLRFKSAQCKAINAVLSEIVAAQNADWVKHPTRSVAEARARAVKMMSNPALRVVGRGLKSRHETSQSTGNKFLVVSTVPKVVTAEDVAAILEWAQDKDAQEWFGGSVAPSFEKRVTEAKKLIA